MDTRLVAEPVWTWPIVVLAAIGLPTLVLLTYPVRVRHLPKFTRRLLIGCRLAASSLLVLAMLRPELQMTETDKRSAVLMVVGDASRSMSTPDGPGGMTRRAQLLRILETNGDRLEDLQKVIDVRTFDFDSSVRSIEQPKADTPGLETAIGAMLQQLLKEVEGQQIVGIVVLSDGAQRTLSLNSPDPRNAARELGQLQIPFYPVPLGEAGVSEKAFDISVDDLTVSPVVFVRNTVSVRSQIRLIGAAGRRFTVRLLVEDRSGLTELQSGTMRVPKSISGAKPTAIIETSENDATLPVDLSFVPDLPGEYRIAVEITPVDDELKRTNNRRDSLITVQRGGITVAYFDRRREESKFLQSLNEARQIQLDMHWVRTGPFAEQTQIPAELFTPGRYDVFIIGDVPAKTFGSKLLGELNRRVDEGAGLMMVGGIQSFGPGGYATTPLAGPLPVLMSPNEIQDEGPPAADLHHDRMLKMMPTEDGERHFVMRLSAADNRTLWAKLPPLRGANRLKRKNFFVQVLATSDDGVPLLFSQQAGRSRVLAFAGDTTFLWAVRKSEGQYHAQEFLRFWRQMILWLARKELDSEQPLHVRVNPRNFASQDTVPIEFGLRDDQGNPVPDVQFQVQIQPPEGDPQQVQARVVNDEGFAEFNETSKAGVYRVVVSASKDGEAIGVEGTTRFLVEERDLELDNPAADPALLNELALLTGGRLLNPGDLESYLDELIDQGPPNVSRKRVTRFPLWDNWGFLGAFVVLMSIEWFVRKRRGLV